MIPVETGRPLFYKYRFSIQQNSQDFQNLTPPHLAWLAHPMPEDMLIIKVQDVLNTG